MLYFTLPNFYNHTQLNSILSTLAKTKIETFIEPIQFISNYENLPYCYFNGGMNNNNGIIYKYHELEAKAQRRTNNAKRLDFSNLLVNEEEDIYDCYFNIILNLYNNGSNFIEVSNLKFADYLAKREDLLYDLIFSANADIMNEFNSDILNDIIEYDIFKLISLPLYYTKDIDFIKAINKRSKLEITVNNICGNCTKNCQKDCIVKEHNNLYNFSNNSIYKSCNNFILYNSNKNEIISINDILAIYKPLGITHFKLCNYPDKQGALNDFIFFFVHYFIKPEFREEILYIIIKELEND